MLLSPYASPSLSSPPPVSIGLFPMYSIPVLHFSTKPKKVIWLHYLPACRVLSHILRFVTLYPWNFPGKNTGGGCHFLLQGIFPGPGIESLSSVSPALQVDSLLAEPLGKLTWPASFSHFCINFS